MAEGRARGTPSVHLPAMHSLRTHRLSVLLLVWKALGVCSNNDVASVNSPKFANGRFVKIHFGNPWICVGSIQILGKQNLELAMKPLSHSGEFFLAGSPDAVLDGNPNTCFIATSFENQSKGQWIVLDLGSEKAIHHLTITNKECGCEEFEWISVSVGTDEPSAARLQETIRSFDHDDGAVDFEDIFESLLWNRPVGANTIVVNFAPTHLEDVCTIGSLKGPSCYIYQKVVHMGNEAELSSKGSLFLVNSTVIVSSEDGMQPLSMTAAQDIHLEANSRVVSVGSVSFMCQILFVSSGSSIEAHTFSVNANALHLVAGSIKATRRAFPPRGHVFERWAKSVEEKNAQSSPCRGEPRPGQPRDVAAKPEAQKSSLLSMSNGSSGNESRGAAPCADECEGIRGDRPAAPAGIIGRSGGDKKPETEGLGESLRERADQNGSLSPADGDGDGDAGGALAPNPKDDSAVPEAEDDEAWVAFTLEIRASYVQINAMASVSASALLIKAEDLSVEGVISASGMGYPPDLGPGRGACDHWKAPCGGGGHGGLGGEGMRSRASNPGGAAWQKLQIDKSERVARIGGSGGGGSPYLLDTLRFENRKRRRHSEDARKGGVKPSIDEAYRSPFEHAPLDHFESGQTQADAMGGKDEPPPPAAENDEKANSMPTELDYDKSVHRPDLHGAGGGLIVLEVTKRLRMWGDAIVSADGNEGHHGTNETLNGHADSEKPRLGEKNVSSQAHTVQYSQFTAHETREELRAEGSGLKSQKEMSGHANVSEKEAAAGFGSPEPPAPFEKYGDIPDEVIQTAIEGESQAHGELQRPQLVAKHSGSSGAESAVPMNSIYRSREEPGGLRSEGHEYLPNDQSLAMFELGRGQPQSRPETYIPPQGGGAGGTIVLDLKDEAYIVGNGIIQCKGGNGGRGGGGGGGGGIVVLEREQGGIANVRDSFSGSVDVGKGLSENKDGHGSDGIKTHHPECHPGHWRHQIVCKPCEPPPRNSHYISGEGCQFQCDPGFILATDDFGQEFCEKIMSLTSLIAKFGGPVFFSLSVFGISAAVAAPFVWFYYRFEENERELTPMFMSRANRLNFRAIRHLRMYGDASNGGGVSKGDNITWPRLSLLSHELKNHLHRIYLTGFNTFDEPLHLHYQEKGEDILNQVLGPSQSLIFPTRFKRFAKNMNKILNFKLWERIMYILLSLVYFPLSNWFMSRRRQHRIQKGQAFQHSYDHDFFKSSTQRNMCNSLRFGYSRCFTLAWIDILVFDKVVSESRGLLLGPRMPFFLVCSGRGSYECPFHLEVEDSMVRKAGECFGSTWGIFLVHLNQYLRTLTQSEILELQSSSSAADDKKLLGDGFSTGYLGGSSSTERQDHIEKKFERFKSKRIFWRKDREQRLQGLRSMIRSMKTSNVGLQLAVQMHNSSEDSLLRPVLIVRELLPKIVRPKVKIASPAKLEKNQAELHRRRQKEEEYRPLSRDKKHTSLDIQAPLKFGGNESLAHSHFSPGGSEDRKETAVPPEVATQESEQVDVAPAAQERDRSKNVVHFGLESFESDMKRTVGISSPSLKDNTSQTPNPIKRERKTKQKMTVPSGSNTYNDRNDEDHSVEQYDLMAVEEWNDDRFMEKLLRHRGSDASSGSNNDNSKLFRPILTTINSNDIDDNVSVEVSLSPEVFEPERDSPMGDGKHEHFQGLPAADSVENFLPYADAENLGRIPPNIKTLADLESESRHSGKECCNMGGPFTNRVASRQKWHWAMLVLGLAILHIWVDFVMSVILIEHLDVVFLAVVCIFPLASYISPFIGLACLIIHSPELGRYFVTFNVLSITNAAVAILVAFTLSEPDFIAMIMATLLVGLKLLLCYAMNQYVAHLEWMKDWKLSYQRSNRGFGSMLMSHTSIGHESGRENEHIGSHVENPTFDGERYQSFHGAFRSISR